MEKIFIVLPVHNRLASTRTFLDSVRQQTFKHYEVVICDDGSTDGTSDCLTRHYPEVTLIQGSGDLWWAAGINRCIRYVLENAGNSDSVLTINNDVTIAPDYLEQKSARAKEYPGALIGSLCVYRDNPDLIETSGFVADFKRATSSSLTKRGASRTEEHAGVREVTHLPGKGVLIPVSVFREIGLYDEQNFPQYHADSDFILRAYKAGYKVLVDFDSIVRSDINLDNMTIPSQEMTLKGILKTFKGPYSPNNFRINYNTARKHFPNRRVRYLATKYSKIIGGMFLRYVRYKMSLIGKLSKYKK